MEDNFPLKKLPADLLGHVISFLPTKAKLNASLVNKYWRKITKTQLTLLANETDKRALSDLVANFDKLSPNTNKAILNNFVLFNKHDDQDKLPADLRLDLIQKNIENNKPLTNQQFLFIQLCLKSFFYQKKAFFILKKIYNHSQITIELSNEELEELIQHSFQDFLEVNYPFLNSACTNQAQDYFIQELEKENNNDFLSNLKQDLFERTRLSNTPAIPRSFLRELNKQFPIITDLQDTLIAKLQTSNNISLQYNYILALTLIFNNLSNDNKNIIFSYIQGFLYHIENSENKELTYEALLLIYRIYRDLTNNQKQTLATTLNPLLAQSNHVLDIFKYINKIWDYLSTNDQNYYFNLYLSYLPSKINLLTFRPGRIFFKLSTTQKNKIAENLISYLPANLEKENYNTYVVNSRNNELANLIFLAKNITCEITKAKIFSRINQYIQLCKDIDYSAFNLDNMLPGELNIYKNIFEFLSFEDKNIFISKLCKKLDTLSEDIKIIFYYLDNFIDFFVNNSHHLTSAQKFSFIFKIYFCLNSFRHTEIEDQSIIQHFPKVIYFAHKSGIIDPELIENATIKYAQIVITNDIYIGLRELPTIVSYIWPDLNKLSSMELNNAEQSSLEI